MRFSPEKNCSGFTTCFQWLDQRIALVLAREGSWDFLQMAWPVMACGFCLHALMKIQGPERMSGLTEATGDFLGRKRGRRNREPALAWVPSAHNGTQALGDFSPESTSWSRLRRSPLFEQTAQKPPCLPTQTPTPRRLGVPWKSGTERQLAAPLGGRVNSGADGKSDTIGPRRAPRQPPTQRGLPRACRGVGWGGAAAVSLVARVPAVLWAPRGPRPGRGRPSALFRNAPAARLPGRLPGPPPPGAG